MATLHRSTCSSLCCTWTKKGASRRKSKISRIFTLNESPRSSCFPYFCCAWPWELLSWLDQGTREALMHWFCHHRIYFSIFIKDKNYYVHRSIKINRKTKGTVNNIPVVIKRLPKTRSMARPGPSARPGPTDICQLAKRQWLLPYDSQTSWIYTLFVKLL